MNSGCQLRLLNVIHGQHMGYICQNDTLPNHGNFNTKFGYIYLCSSVRSKELKCLPIQVHQQCAMFSENIWLYVCLPRPQYTYTGLLLWWHYNNNFKANFTIDIYVEDIYRVRFPHLDKSHYHFCVDPEQHDFVFGKENSLQKYYFRGKCNWIKVEKYYSNLHFSSEGLTYSFKDMKTPSKDQHNIKGSNLIMDRIAAQIYKFSELLWSYISCAGSSCKSGDLSPASGCKTPCKGVLFGIINQSCTFLPLAITYIFPWFIHVIIPNIPYLCETGNDTHFAVYDISKLI